MPRSPSRFLLPAALLTLLLATLWSLRCAPDPNSDRYDYLGPAWSTLRGEGMRAQLVYPLQLALPGGERWPVRNVARPPGWPAALVPLLRWGAGERAGVLLGALCMLALVLLLFVVAERTFGAGAGGIAALACASSFATCRALWGGGPEPALALLTYTLWTWSPRGQSGLAHLACGTLYGVLPLLHPVGWLLAGLALLARAERYDRRGWLPLLLGAALIALPWHLHTWQQCGTSQFYVQQSAELAKSIHDPAGLGPYRGLTAWPTFDVLRAEPLRVARAAAHHLSHMVTHLDAWLAWPLLLLAAWGMREAPALARRDLALLGACLLLLSPWSHEVRLLLPLLPVACTWVGAGLAACIARGARRTWTVAATVLCVTPWVLPLGAARSPGTELRAMPPAVRRPPAGLVLPLHEAPPALAPIVTDSAALAWQAHRTAILLPDTPATLERLRATAGLRQVELLALAAGRHSRWTALAAAQWDSLLALCQPLVELHDGGLIVRLPPSGPAAASHTDAQP